MCDLVVSIKVRQFQHTLHAFRVSGLCVFWLWGWPAREPRYSASKFTHCQICAPSSAATSDTSAVAVFLEDLDQQIHPFHRQSL